LLSLTLNNCTHIYKHISSELNLKLVLKHIQHTFLPLWFCGPSSANDLIFFRFLGWHTLDAAHSVGRLWTKDQADIENSVWQTQYTNNKLPCPFGIRKHNLSRRSAKFLRLTPRENWELQSKYVVHICSKNRHAGALMSGSNIQ